MLAEIKNETIALKVNTLGAEIKSLVKEGVEYMWQADASIWRQTAPNLFPFVGRSYEGEYSYNDKKYKMMPHGFLSKLEFKIITREEDYLALEATDNSDTLAIYPFSFSYVISYRLLKNKVLINHKITNKNDYPMYFGLGMHPGFNVPLDKGLDFSDYYLEFSSTCYPMEVELTPNLQMSGNAKDYPIKDNRIIPLDHHLFDFDSITLKNIARSVSLKSDKGKRMVKVSYPQMGFLGLWHKPKCEAPYLCIEPWVTLPGRELCEDISSKSDNIALEAKGIYNNSWSIEIE